VKSAGPLTLNGAPEMRSQRMKTLCVGSVESTRGWRAESRRGREREIEDGRKLGGRVKLRRGGSMQSRRERRIEEGAQDGGGSTHDLLEMVLGTSGSGGGK